MPVTVPSLTEKIDNAFMHTWYRVRKQVSDNVLKGTPVVAALRQRGCYKRQVGGRFITRGIQYDYVEPVEFERGELLGEGDKETDTQGFWTWRYMSAPIQRTLVDDQQNQGEDKIRDLVATKIERVRQGFPQKHEKDFWNAHVTDESGKKVQGINDLMPPAATRATGTYGKIARPTTFASDVPTVGNTFWTPLYRQFVTPLDVTLISEMRTAFNTVEANQEAPDLIITNQTLFELYEEFGQDAGQVMISGTTRKLLDLGFQALQYKGATLIWTPNITVNDMFFMTTSYYDVVYDPNYWMAMTHWKDTSGGKGQERLAHIVSVLNTLSDQPRRFLRLYS